MAFEHRIGLQQKLKQTLVITPQLKAAIKILQLSRTDLDLLVTEEFEQNPALEELGPGEEDIEIESDTPGDDRMPDLIDPTQEESRAPAEGELAEITADESRIGEIDWAEYLANYATNETHGSLTAGAGTGADYDEDSRPTVENTLARAFSLGDHLFWQLRMGGFEPDEVAVGDVLIGNVDENGYLRISVEEVATEAGVDPEIVERTLARMQRFDPPGVFARGVAECLLIQLRQLEGIDPVLLERAIKIAGSHLDLVESRRFEKLSKETGFSKREIGQAVDLISSLEPKPGRSWVTEDPRYVMPDVFVYKMDGVWAVSLNDDGMPRLRVSDAYRRLLTSEGGQEEAKAYIRDKLASAHWLIRSIHQRQSTLMKVTNSIVRFQEEFFEHGVKALRPLILKDVANDIGMHESTVSRATANKWVHTPQGTLELKYFFTTSIRSADGEGVSAESVKDKIRHMISDEDTRRPFSDQHIAESLSNDGIEIARRTVAKYRETMGILPSSRRKHIA